MYTYIETYTGQMQLLIVATYCYKVPDGSRRYRHIQEQIVAGILGDRSR
jgi:hypothetical protein